MSVPMTTELIYGTVWNCHYCVETKSWLSHFLLSKGYNCLIFIPQIWLVTRWLTIDNRIEYYYTMLPSISVMDTFDLSTVFSYFFTSRNMIHIYWNCYLMTFQWIMILRIYLFLSSSESVFLIVFHTSFIKWEKYFLISSFAVLSFFVFANHLKSRSQ